jgi:hypothetical protein
MDQLVDNFPEIHCRHDRRRRSGEIRAAVPQQAACLLIAAVRAGAALVLTMANACPVGQADIVTTTLLG